MTAAQWAWHYFNLQKDAGSFGEESGQTVVNDGYVLDMYQHIGLDATAKVLGISTAELSRQLADKIPDLVEVE